MKRFRFRLEPLLRLRAHKEEEWRLKLGQAQAECSRIENQIQMLHRERSAVFASDAGNDMDYHLSRALYLGRIEDKTRELQQDLTQAYDRKEEVLKTYTEARREYEAINKIKEKRVAEYRKEWFREEAKEIDDIANSRIAGGYRGTL